MLNQVILVGKVVKINTVDTVTTITLSIENRDRSYDEIPVVLDGNLNNAIEYVKEGTTLGVKARIRHKANVEVIAEKLTFINTKKED